MRIRTASGGGKDLAQVPSGEHGRRPPAPRPEGCVSPRGGCRILRGWSEGPVSAILFFTCSADAFAPDVCFAATEFLERFASRSTSPVQTAAATAFSPEPGRGPGRGAQAPAQLPRRRYVVTPPAPARRWSGTASPSSSATSRDAFGGPRLRRAHLRALRFWSLSGDRSEIPLLRHIDIHESCGCRRGGRGRSSPDAASRIPGSGSSRWRQRRGAAASRPFSVRTPQISCAMTERKIERILATGADTSHGDMDASEHPGDDLRYGTRESDPLAQVLAGPAPAEKRRTGSDGARFPGVRAQRAQGPTPTR